MQPTTNTTQGAKGAPVVSERTIAKALRANGYARAGEYAKAGFKGWSIEAVHTSIIVEAQLVPTIAAYRVFFETQGRAISEPLMRSRLAGYAAALNAAGMTATVAYTAKGEAYYVLVSERQGAAR